VSLEPREVEITRFDMTGRDGPNIRFAVEASSGTYVRALARDVGRALGCGGHLAALRRTRVGPFAVDDAIPSNALDSAPELRSAREAVAHLPAIELDADQRRLATHGRPLPIERADDTPVALLSEGALVAIAEPSGELLKMRVVLAG
jgi:tRNA pseudouridine55 synthase